MTDGESVTDTAMVTITVTSGFVAPNAIIAGGDRELASGATVELDGSGSTHDARTTLTYSWARTGGTSLVTGTLTGATTAKPSFTAETLTDGDPDVTHILTLTVTDGESVTDTAMVTITVTSGFVAPNAIIAGGDRELASGATVELDGSGSTHDARTTLTYSWARTGGTSQVTGTLTGATTAKPSFTAETLTDGDPDVTHILTLTVTDGESVTDTAMVTITVTAGFVAPNAIIAGGDRELASGATVELDGSGSTHDARTTLTYSWARTGGTSLVTGTLTGATTAKPSFTAETLTDGDPDVTHILTLTVTDGESVTDTAMVTITVTAGFVAPNAIIAGGDRELASGATVELDGSGSTHDARTTLTYSWARTGGTSQVTGTLTGATTAKPSFTAETLTDGDPDVTHILTLTVTDGESVTDTAMVTITVTSGFVAPNAIIAGGDRELASGATVELDGSGSTHDARTTLTYSWARTGGTSQVTGTLTGATTAKPSFTAETLTDGDPDVTHILTLTVTDGESVTDTAMVTITVTSGFVAPNAIIAGGDRELASGATVELDGSGSTHDARTTLTYSWARTGGTSQVTGTLTGATTAKPSFTAETLTDGDPDVTHILTLTVTDGESVTDTAMVTITVTSGFVAPNAIIAGGDRELASGATVELDGSGSTHDARTTLTYSWARTGGTSLVTGTLTGATTAKPSFTAETLTDGDPDVTHILTLTVTDGESVTDTAMVTITVTSGFVAPNAIIAGGDRELASGATVELDGSGSTHDARTTLTYSWARTGGTSQVTGTLTGATTAKPSFTAETLTDGDPDVTHILTLTVTDGESVTDTAMVTITVTSGFVAPNAIIAGGDRELASGATVELDGSGSTHDARTTLTYSWARTGGTSQVTGTLTGATTAKPSFTAETLTDGDPDVTHILTLTVTDGESVTDTAMVTITVTSGFVAPNAIIAGGDRELASGATVELDGSGSTHDARTTLTYSWARTGGTSQVTGTLTGATTAKPSFTAETLTDGDPDVTHILTLTVTDGESVTDTAMVTITVTAGFVAPNAIIAGGDRELASGATVELDGSGSTHDARTTLTYSWARTGGTSLVTGTLTGATTAKPSFTAETLTDGDPDVTHILTLTVTDGESVTDTAMVTITVTSGFVAPNAIIAGGDRELASGATVELDGSGSTHDARTTLTYSWARTGGTSQVTGTLTGATTAKPSFTAETLTDGDPDVTHILTLTVTDGESVTDTAMVTITVTSGFVAPNAIIAGGDRELASGATVELDGSGSTHDARTTLTYSWARTGGTSLVTGTLTGATTAKPSFTAETLTDGDPDVTHILTLTVTDGESVTDTAMVTITVTSGFVAPDAIIAGGDRELASGATVELDGSGSTHDARTTLTYSWARTGGTSQVTGTLTGATTAKPSFTAETLTDGDPDVTHILTLTVTDGESVTDTAMVTITVTSGFVAPNAIIAGGDRELASGATVELDGSGSTHDARTTLTYSWARTGGTSQVTGTLTGATTAKPSFTAETLTDGDPDVTHILTLTVTDGESVTDTAMVTITVTSGFVAPNAIIAGGDRELASGATVELDGSGSTHDARTTLTYSWARTGGTSLVTGTLTGATTAKPSFTAETLTDGDPDVTHILTLTVTDGESVTDTAMVTITVTSGFVAPNAIIAGGDRELASGATVELDGSGSTHDARTTLTYSWARTGGTSQVTGTLTGATTAKPSFTAETLTDGDPDVTHILTLTVTDGESVTDTAMVTITVTAGFVAPNAIIAGGDRELASGATVELDGSGSTHDARTTLTYSWARTGGTSQVTGTLTGATTAKPSFTAETLTDGDPDVTHILTLTVTDGESVTDTAMVTITVTSGFVAPNAIIAGGDRELASGATVELDGSGSTHDARTTLTYSWARTGGTSLVTGTLTGATTAKPSFTAETLTDGDPDVTHILTLTVTDGESVTDTAMVTITVTAGFVAPNAIIAGGDRELASGATVELDGSGSTHDARTTLTYSWARTGGTSQVTGTLTGATTAKPSFTAETLTDGDPDVTHILTLTVTDGESVTDTAMVTITVTSGFVAPNAIIAGGDRELASGATVELDGSGSTHDARTTLTYSWARTGGTSQVTGTLTGATTAKPSFTAETLTDGDPDVTHILTLTVTDGESVTDTAMVTITVTSGFVAPNAIIAGGDRELASGATVELDGSGSTHDARTTLTYSWARTGGTSQVTGTLTGATTAKPSFTAETLTDGDPDVTHILTLTVTDGESVTDTAMVTITVTSGFVAPNAIIAGGDRELASGATVELDGSGSTHDARTTLTYSWARTGGTSQVTGTLTGATTAKPSFTAETLTDGDPDVTHILTLTVTDGESVTDTAMVTITVTAGFVAPNAIIAGGDRELASGATVELDGSGSTHDARTTLTYSWARTGGTSQVTGTLTGATTAKPSFTAETLTDGDPDVTHILTLTVTDGESVTDTAMVTITVTAGFVAPNAIIAGGDRELASGATVELDGSGSTHDARTTLTYSWARTGGTSQVTGTLTGATTAKPSFTAETLTDGDPDVTHILTLTVTDGESVTDTAMVTITVTSGFVAPNAIIAGGDRELASGATVELDGSGSTHDARTTLTYSWARTGGTSQVTGTLTGATTAKPSFTAETLTDGDPDVTHILTLTVTDGESVTDTAMVTITVTSGFVAPNAIIAGGDRELASGATVELDGSGSTHDARTTLTYSWARTGGTSQVTGTLTGATTAKPSFTAETLTDGDPDVTHILTLTVTDGESVTDTAMVTITVTSGFVAPNAIIAGGDRELASGATVELDGSGSTHDARTTLTYSWARTGGTSLVTGTLTGATTAKPSFTAETLTDGDPDVTHILTLTVTDGESVTDTAMVTITVTSGFVAPNAIIAGGDRELASGATVELDGSGSTHDARTTLTYSWARTGGTSQVTGTLTGATTAKPSFTAETLTDGDPDVTHILTLTVTDGESVTDTAMVTITVTAGFVAPNAIIAGGDRELASGATVELDGSGSTHDARTTLTYSWARTGGTSQVTGTLTGATTAKPSFTAETLTDGDPDVTHILTLTVTDGESVTDTAMVTITVTSGFVAPNAIIAGGDRELASGATVELDGSGSTHDARTTLTYSWARTGGTSQVTGTLTGATTAKPSFTAETLTDGDPDVTHILTLTVTDGESVTDTAMVTITVTSGFVAPNAIIAGGDRELASGATVELDGSGSTHDARTTLTYSWARTGGTSQVTGTLTGATTAKPSFTAETLTDGDPDVTHILTLTVTDGESVTDTAMVTITVTFEFAAPNAIIAGGDRELASGATVELDGSGSTHDARTTLTYSWARTGGTSLVTGTLTGATTAKPSFTAETLTDGDPDVTHILTLTVTDGESVIDTAMVTITVTSGFVDPVADAGDDKLVGSGATVMLDGSGSTHDSRTTVTYAWTRTGGNGGSVTLSSVSAERPTFTADTLADGDPDVTHTFTLTVTDSEGGTDTDTMTVTVTASAVSVDILVSPSELMVQEGGSGTYQVRLSESPGQDVSVLAVSDNENIVLENAQLTFNANNWDAWQEIRIGTVADSDNADNTALIRHSFDPEGVALGQSGVVSVTVREEDAVLKPVGDNLTARATTLLNNFPNLSSFLNQDGTTPGGSSGFTFKATNGRLTLDGGFVRDSVWGEIAGSNTRSESGDTRFVLGSFGIHRRYSERFLAGTMLQIDLADHNLDGLGSIDGTGWLAGPYFAARHGTWPLYFEGRLLYGQSDNDIRFNDLALGQTMRVGSFDTTRLLAQLRIKGEIALSDRDEGPRLIPYADTRWFEDRAAAFTDSIGTRIPGQTVSISQLELGSNVEVPIALSHGAMTFTGGLGLVYSKTEGDYIPSVSRSRGRGEIGFSYGLADNVRIDFESFYDGIGTSGYEGYGLSLNAEIKF